MVLSPELVGKIVGILAAIGVVLPHLQAILQKPWWSPRMKAVLTVVLAVVGGVVAYVATNGIDFSDPVKIALWISGVYAASALQYARLWRPVGTTDALEKGVNGGTPEPEPEGYDPADLPSDDPADYENDPTV